MRRAALDAVDRAPLRGSRRERATPPGDLGDGSAVSEPPRPQDLDRQDLDAVRTQLGRPPRGVHAVAHRCPCGLPDVVETEPRLPDGTPFPTLFYITCPRLAGAVGTLEAAGLMREMTDRLDADDDLAAAHAAAHAAYLRRRARLDDVPEIDGISAGGMPNRVKCLHALAGHALAEGAGVNPLGDEAVQRLPDWWAQGRCVDVPSASTPTATRPLPHPLTGVPMPSPVLPGAGWPEDPGEPTTSVAHDRADVARLAAEAGSPGELDARVSVCRACPRLVGWREEVARTKRRSFADQPYWGRPSPGFGDPRARVLVLGLAPAAHGANRTGRVFTGDRSGDWLFRALHAAGLATRPSSEHTGDGFALVSTRVVPAVRCAPPANRPTTDERDTCAPWLRAEAAALWPTLRVVVALGGFAWDAALRLVRDAGGSVPRPVPRFGHAVEAALGRPGGGSPVLLLGSYHPSQQNTFTGRLTDQMLAAVMGRAAAVGVADGGRNA